MTVAELIDKLSKYSQDARVIIDTPEDWYEVKNVCSRRVKNTVELVVSFK